MPLNSDAVELIRGNLEHCARGGGKPRLVVIGCLTDEQLSEINLGRVRLRLPPIVAEVVFVGSHVYESRVVRDGYTIGDVIAQIASAMASESYFRAGPKHGTMIESFALRADGYGNYVRDRAVFECTSKHPRPELYSVVPKGDKIKPISRQIDKGRDEAALVGNLTDLPG